MRFISFFLDGKQRIGCPIDQNIVDLSRVDSEIPTDFGLLIAQGPEALSKAHAAALKAGSEAYVDANDITYLPLITRPPKIICIGRNYAAHAKEGGVEPPSYPEIFYRGSSSLIGHNQPILRPLCSDKLDYEAELVAIIGKRARHVSKENGLDYIAGYSIFNDGTLRDYQRRSSQWTIGKNFDDTGAFGPEFVSADELPPGASGLRIQTRLNGRIMQDANTSDFIFPMNDLIAKLSECMTLEPGDVIVTGTPAGVGYARTPPIYMKEGDVCEVEIQDIGILKNPIHNEV